MFLAASMLALAHAPANADQNDPKLDKLFAALQTSLSNASAASLENEIWTIWTRFPDDQAINRQMDRAIKMMNAGRLDDAEAMFSAIMRLPSNDISCRSSRPRVLQQIIIEIKPNK